MGLAQQQRVLARLYTDTSVRERFFAQPQEKGEALGLSPDEAKWLALVSAVEVNFFAASLKRKRLNEVSKLVPLTRCMLGSRFAAFFMQYADTQAPKGSKNHRSDVIAFSSFIENLALIDELDPPWAADLIRYEAAWQTANDPRRRWAMRWFRYPISKIVRSLAQGNGMPLSRVQPTIALWFRLSRRRGLRHLVLSLPRFS